MPGGRRGRRHGKGNKARVMHNSLVDTGMLGLDHSGRKIREKPHCPGCGRVYKGDTKLGVEYCYWCKQKIAKGEKPKPGKFPSYIQIDTFIESNDDDVQG